MKLRTRIAITAATISLLLFTISCESQAETDKLAVASAFGRFQAFLLSTNYAAAYEMMCSDFRRNMSLENFKARDEHGNYAHNLAGYSWNHGATIVLNGSRAELRIKYNVSFGTLFNFIKEDGEWRIVDQTSGFETLRP